MNRFPAARCARGFTLIELLVVIAIIALIVAIMLPALAAARDMGIQARCLAQMKQMGEALVMYAGDDPNQRYPRARMMNMGNTWIEDIEHYISTESFYRCPADDAETWPTRFTSYGLNGYLTHNHSPYRGMRMEQMHNASATVIVAEMADSQTKDHFMPMVWGDPIAQPSVLPGLAMSRMHEWDDVLDEQKPVEPYRHMDQSNYAFGDGHAAIPDFDETWFQITGSTREVDRYDPQFDG